MKKSRNLFLIVCLLLTLTFSAVLPQTGVQAATLTNVMKAPSAKKGQWVLSSAGYRYRYNATGKYAKSVWLKIGGKIYYFRSNGYAKTGWKKYNSKMYYFDDNGALVTGWKKIGSYYYYFRLTDGRMAVNQKVGKYYVNERGRRTTTTTTTTTTSNAAGTETDKQETKKTGKVDIWVGGSRTVGMANTMSLDSGSCIMKVSGNYDWLVSTALSSLKAKLKKNPSATVVLSMGVNDVYNYNNYIKKYKSLIKSYPKARFFFLSINPVDKKYTWGALTYSQMAASIKTFNSAIKKAFPDNYLDCYSYLKKSGFSTTDGVHYSAKTYKAIYQYVLDQV